MKTKKYQGLFITFEGGEGPGKGTQLRLLSEYLKPRYIVEVGREPGATEQGEIIRNILQNPLMPKVDPRTELLLYEAARVEYVKGLVIPALKQGKIFISDRFYDSTLAYQGALGLDRHLINIFNKFASFGLIPDLTFLIDIDAELGLEMVGGYEFGKKLDKIEQRNLKYHQTVNRIYREIAKQNSRFRIIPYRKDEIDEMQIEVRKEFDKFIEKNNLECRLLKSN